MIKRAYENLKQMAYLEKVVELALEEVGVREVPRNSNRGQRVEQYQRSVGEYAVGKAWCSTFCYFICKEAAKIFHRPTLVKKTGRAVNHWITAPEQGLDFVTVEEAEKVGPGWMFIQVADAKNLEGVQDRSITRVPGHIGFVLSPVDENGYFETLEGNTNVSGSREGGGVYLRQRHVSERIVGFVKPKIQ